MHRISSESRSRLQPQNVLTVTQVECKLKVYDAIQRLDPRQFTPRYNGANNLLKSHLQSLETFQGSVQKLKQK